VAQKLCGCNFSAEAIIFASRDFAYVGHAGVPTKDFSVFDHDGSTASAPIEFEHKAPETIHMKTFLGKMIVAGLRRISRKSNREFNDLAGFYFFLTRSNIKAAWLAFWD